MGFVLRRDREFALALTHQGPVAVLELEFSFVFVSGLWGDAIDELEAYLRLALFSTQVLPMIQANYLGYTIESDTHPLIDRYRVSVMLAGEVERSQGVLGPFPPFAQHAPQALFAIPPLIVIATALGIALVFAAIAWRTYTVGLGGALFGKGPVGTIAMAGAVALGLFLVLGGRRESA